MSCIPCHAPATIRKRTSAKEQRQIYTLFHNLVTIDSNFLLKNGEKHDFVNVSTMLFLIYLVSYLLISKRLKEKRLWYCRLSILSPHTTWISWNDQLSKSVMESSVSIVSFDWLLGYTWRWGISSLPCNECTSCFYSYSRYGFAYHPLQPHKCRL